MSKHALAAAFLLSMTGFATAQVDSAAGPDFWAVSGLSVGSSLNVRSGPSSSASVTVQIGEGTIVRNLGCQGTGTQRWCQIQSPDGLAISGWANGKYLRESSPPSDADAVVAGTSYNATGTLPCRLEAFPTAETCPFGVIRASTGLASVFITLPDGAERLIEFRDGTPVTPTGSTLQSSRVDDLTTLVLDGGREAYTIADVVFHD